MRRALHPMLLVLALQACASKPALTDADPFSIRVPIDWQVGRDKNLIAIFGPDTWDGWPAQTLFIDSCTKANPTSRDSLLNCNKPCTSKTLSDLLSEEPKPDENVEIEARALPDGSFEYVAEATTPVGAGARKLICRDTGQAYMQLEISRQRKEGFRNDLDFNLKWLFKWKSILRSFSWQ